MFVMIQPTLGKVKDDRNIEQRSKPTDLELGK